MPSLSKKSLSLFLRNGCERQFVLSLYNDTERAEHSMPVRQKARAGLGLTARAGYEWQDEKVSELRAVFGEANVHLNPVLRGKRPGPLGLFETLPKVTSYQFIVEAAYAADTTVFRSSLGLDNLTDYFGEPVNIGATHPDIIQVLPPTSANLGPGSGRKINPYELGVQPNGDTFALGPSDNRLRLRVIDVKLASEPGAHYFAEVVYYSITLAAWLIERNLDDNFVVVAAPAVWPGSHEASNLAQQRTAWEKAAHVPTAAEWATTLEEDIEVPPFDVFAPRLRRFLANELPSMLGTSWAALGWHIDFRCKGCEFLGYPWIDKAGELLNDPSQCWPTAESSGHLSRVFGLSRGASEQLRGQQISDVSALASISPAAPVFNEHQGLRAKRTTFPHRAAALQTSQASMIPDSGGDALMPRWPDLHIYVFLDYDLSSAITASIALRAFWLEPLPYGSELTRHTSPWIKSEDESSGKNEIWLIDQRSIAREREEFLKFLRRLKQVMGEVVRQDEEDANAGRRDNKTRASTYQLYLWDESQRKHLIRLIGRHLPYILADPKIRDLAWLFPPPELLQHAEDATRKSPITLVFNVVSNTVAIPAPHHYRLLDVAKAFPPVGGVAPSVHPLYEEPMSDLIPAERIYEWWQRIGQWQERQKLIEETCKKKVDALSLVVRRLEKELNHLLSRQAAPALVRPAPAMHGVTPQGRLWYEYSRLNAALDDFEVQSIRAMPPHEREARLKSARLSYRLTGQEEQQALAQLNALGHSLSASPDLFVYQMRANSRDVNLSPGDFLYALAPEGRHGFLDDSAFRHVVGTSLQHLAHGAQTIAEAGWTGVTVEAIDRESGLIALRGGHNCCIPQLEKETPLDFSLNVILDPVYQDFLIKKIKLTVQGIGYPAVAGADQRIWEALGLDADTAPGTTAPSPASEMLWEAPAVHAQLTDRDVQTIRGELQEYFDSQDVKLDESQWGAWSVALSRRLSLIWGPPGTGKSQTLRAVVLGSVLDAVAHERPLRILITANTYNAVDNVLLKVEAELRGLLPAKPYAIYRVQSKWRPISPGVETEHPGLSNLVLNTANPSTDIVGLRSRLELAAGITIVGCPPQQLHNLSVAGKKSASHKPKDTMRPWFDLIILDEATQMDVATSTLVLSKLAPGGACVLAGDDLQLPPIHPADPPEDLEHLVGSAYNYLYRYHSIQPCSLDMSYRSNRTIIDLVKIAGYSANLDSYSPDLRLQLSTPIPDLQPDAWPSGLYWSSAWAKFLDPAYPAVCFVYEDVLSSQVNDFEADTVAALIWLLNGRLADRLIYERRSDGTVDSVPSVTPYTPTRFWDEAVGVVTPHRVQRAKITRRLQEIFPTHSPEGIRAAVDTVERFQGQQRDVIIASFGLGDPDIISAEDEFLYNLNRFNVLISRARAKVIVLVSRSLLEHLSDDVAVLEESRLLKQFAESYCKNPEEIQLGFSRNQALQLRTGMLRRT